MQGVFAGKKDRIRKGICTAAGIVVVFCLAVGAVVCIFAEPLVSLFIEPFDADIVAAGTGYLKTVAVCYTGIGFLFLFYGFFRAVHRPGFSLILTVISLGTRVALAYVLAGVSTIGVTGIWLAIPIGWVLADIVGAAGLWIGCRRDI